jgi:cytochrome c553
MKKNLVLTAVMLTITSLSGNGIAGDAAAGKAKAAACNGCHMPGNPAAPALAAMPEPYLIEATKAYKNGARNHAQMTALVAGLSDADIQDISAYYAAESPCR